MRKNYPYLKDSEYMYLADTQKIQNQFVKLTLLDWNENPLEEIQGIATGGTISINGSSAIRRTCSLSMTVKDVSTGKITDAKNLISINKKVYIEIGIVNKTMKYKEYPILWYPQGTMVFTQCSVSTGLDQGISLSAQLKDKMCLLNGECGGVITSSVVLDHYDTLEDTNGSIITTYPTINRIIRELVNHFGGEQLGKIIINNIDEKAKMVVRWLGENPLYFATKDSSHLFTTSEAAAYEFGGTVQEFKYGQDVGFVNTDFIWTGGDLIANTGDNVCTILDKIKSYLGNFEYFYDIDGNFIFQEIQNYLNTTQATVDLRRMNNNDYVIDISKGKSVYDLTDNKLITSFSNNIQYTKIKNDFVVWGIREDVSGVKLPIRYHLAIDKKPATGNIYEVFFYDDPDDGLRKAKCPIKYDNKAAFPEIGVEGLFYLDNNTGMIYKWDAVLMNYVSVEGNPIIEYNSYSDLPGVGQEGVVYRTTSDDKLYSWAIVPGSTHYNNIAAQIENLTVNYETSLRPYQQQIENHENTKAQYESELSDLENQYLRWIIQKRALDKEINNLNEQIDEFTTAIEEKEDLIDGYDEQIEILEAEIAVLQEQYEEETNPFVKEEILTQINTKQLEVNSLEMRIANLEQDLRMLRPALANLESQLSEKETELAPIDAELTDYTAEKNRINALIENEDAAIADIENIMARLEQTYLDAKADLVAHQGEYIKYKGASLIYVQATDWRSELYLSGAAAEPLGLESNYYYTELEAEWPKLYNLQADSYTDAETGHTVYTGAFYEDILDNPWDVDYWLDFIDSEAAISQFNISNIGRRSITKTNNDYNCVFEPEIPDIVIIEAGSPTADAERQECEDRNQDYCQVDSNIYEALSIGGMHNSCFTEIKNMLWENTDYNASISVALVPIYHLEPNTRITINSNDADIHGDFMIESMSIPLTIGGTMSISASQVETKL